MSENVHIKLGDKVAVPWGLHEVIGIVVELHGPAAHRFALVRVPTEGPNGETLEESDVSLPESTLRLVSAA